LENQYDVIVVGGGQSGLAVGYYLRRTGLNFIILDNQSNPGGAWTQAWNSLQLFSPAQWSSLPGIMMNGGSNYPTKRDAAEYLASYEKKYNLPVKRPVEVFQIAKVSGGFHIKTSEEDYFSKAVVSATGTFSNPFIPAIKGMQLFEGQILHSCQYKSADNLVKKKVAIVGEGNSGAQILAEVSRVTDTLWIAKKPPRYHPDDVDGRYLFDAATQLYEAQKKGKEYTPPSFSDIVMVESVKEARSRNVLHSVSPFDHFTRDSIVWTDGKEEKIEVVIFCTGFKASLRHLKSLRVITATGKIETDGTKAKNVSGLWLVGYGNWTGFASATLIGVGRSAKTTVAEIIKYFASSNPETVNK
jgi:putative flavoprotein involved in K+ transport